MDKSITENLRSKSRWTKIVYIVLFFITFEIAEIVLWTIAIVQVFFSLFTGEPNQQLLKAGAQLSTYIGEVGRFVTYKTELKPFPFKDWPKG
jgi:hypothetical protein